MCTCVESVSQSCWCAFSSRVSGNEKAQLRRARSRPYLHKNPRVIGVSNATRRDLAVGAKRKKLNVDFTMKKGRERQPSGTGAARPLRGLGTKPRPTSLRKFMCFHQKNSLRPSAARLGNFAICVAASSPLGSAKWRTRQ